MGALLSGETVSSPRWSETIFCRGLKVNDAHRHWLRLRWSVTTPPCNERPWGVTATQIHHASTLMDIHMVEEHLSQFYWKRPQRTRRISMIRWGHLGCRLNVGWFISHANVVICMLSCWGRDNTKRLSEPAAFQIKPVIDGYRREKGPIQCKAVRSLKYMLVPSAKYSPLGLPAIKGLIYITNMALEIKT